MGFGTDFFDGVTKMRAATLLGKTVRLQKRTKIPIKYVNKNSKYGHIFAITVSDTQE